MSCFGKKSNIILPNSPKPDVVSPNKISNITIENMKIHNGNIIRSENRSEYLSKPSSLDSKVYYILSDDNYNKKMNRIALDISDFRFVNKDDILYIKQYIPHFGKEILNIHNKISNLIDVLYVNRKINICELQTGMVIPSNNGILTDDVMNELVEIGNICSKIILSSIDETLEH
jgi:hypothetical protein